MGIHAGRANQDWETGRKTNGCIRIIAAGFEAIGDVIAEYRPLGRIIVQYNLESKNSNWVNNLNPGYSPNWWQEVAF